MTRFYTSSIRNGIAIIGASTHDPMGRRNGTVMFSFDVDGNLRGVFGPEGLATTAFKNLQKEARLHHLAYNFAPPATHMRAYRVTPASPDDREDIAWGWDCDDAARRWLTAHPGRALSASCLWEPLP